MTRSPTRLLPDLAGLSAGERASLLAFAALLLVVTGALFVPRGGQPHDGGLTPTTGSPSPTASTAPAPAPDAADTADAAEQEIDRVLATSPGRLDPQQDLRVLARELVRCAELDAQRYCLGLGWTSLSEREAERRAATAVAPTTGADETTGDLTLPDLLARRAAMSPSRRLAVERRELEAAARAASKVATLRHEVLGEPLPAGLATSATAGRTREKRLRDYPRRATVLRARRVTQQRRTYWCGPATMQMIAWGWQRERRGQRHWARRLGTTTAGSSITDMVRVVNRATGYDSPSYAGKYVVLDISDWSFREWLLLQMRHVEDYRAPVVLHPLLHKRFFPYLDDDASGHFQVGRGYDKNGRKPATLGFFEPWNQQRFDRSEPFIGRVQWRSAYRSYRANRAHPQQNIGV